MESLGYNKDGVSNQLKSDIIDSLLDPVENIYISSKHISDLRDNEYAGKIGSEITDNYCYKVLPRFRYEQGKE